jgi:hypothetical protein
MLFNLMGDGNMHWATAMSKIERPSGGTGCGS